MGQMGRRRSGKRKRPRVGMGTPRLIRLKDPRFVWSHLRAAVVDLVRVHPVAVDDDAAKLLGGAAHALLSMDLGKVRREVSVCQIGTPRRLHFARVVSASRGVPRFSRRGTRDGDGAGRTLATFLTLPTSPDISPKDRGVRPSAGRCDQRSHFTGAPIETEPCPAVSLLVKSPRNPRGPFHSCGALE